MNYKTKQGITLSIIILLAIWLVWIVFGNEVKLSIEFLIKEIKRYKY